MINVIRWSALGFATRLTLPAAPVASGQSGVTSLQAFAYDQPMAGSPSGGSLAPSVTRTGF
jgi:hypothetical protein